MSVADDLRLRILAVLMLADATFGCDGASQQPSASAASKTDPSQPPVAEVAKTPDPVAKTTLDPSLIEDLPPEPVAKTTLDPSLIEDKPPEPVAKTTMDPSLIRDIALPEEPPRPTCPSGLWCGVVTPPATGPDTAHGCPNQVTALVKPLDAASGHLPPWQTGLNVEATDSKRAEGTNDACCYTWTEPCPGGRPLRDGESIVRSTFAAAKNTSALATRVVHRAAADAWLQDAGFEYASVASFARAAIELMAVGAPAQLVEDCHRAALDEIRHARLCSEIAWSLGAAQEIPAQVAAVRPRPSTLAQLAADTFVEGCVGETLAALVARVAAQGCQDPGIRERLEAIAEDEERHAALAWRTIRWALSVGGEEVAQALRSAASAARPSARAPQTDPKADTELAMYGRLGASAQRDVQRDGWRNAIDPLLAGVLVPPLEPSSVRARLSDLL